ncbi:MAG: hypothetical protein NWE98_10590 [Candidatus Bathyarchaeota archaeon]|nr:hypothetical protein [Candidatus Bathyarchaeota archaeon]
MEKSSNNCYVLTSFGKKAVEQLDLVAARTSSEDEKYVKIASLSQKASLQPIVRVFLAIGVAMSAVVLSVWAFLAYIAITEGAPVIVYVLLPLLLAVGFVLLGSLIYALVRTPLWIKRFEHRLFGEP